VGLELDEAGWTKVGDLIEAALARYGWVQPRHVRAVLAGDPRGRFQTREGRVRATYGHSVDVDVDVDEGAVPSRLYHGTARRNVAAIRAEGLRPMDRREVHLSPSVEEAREVGRRHGDEVVVFAVDVDGLRADGIAVDRRSPVVFTCPRVPPAHLELHEAPAD